MGKKRKVVRKVDALAEQLGELWGMPPRMAAIRAMDDALMTARMESGVVPKGVDDLVEAEILREAEDLYRDIGAFQVRDLIRFMWGSKVHVVGRYAVAKVVSGVLRSRGWIRKRRMRDGAILYVWLKE
tara:strand:- start:213 stop:596 length:384 start_codon:yes stop_codon:yes gene_type:complete